MRRTYCPTFHGICLRLTIGFLLALLTLVLALPALPQTKFGVVTGSGGGGSGTVTTVNASAVAPLTVSGVPFTTSGTIAIDWTSCSAANVVAAPSGAAGKPTCRLLVAADIPALAPSKITGTAVITSDSRLSDSRTPLAHATTHASAGADPVTIAPSQVTGTAVVTADSRLSDSRTPTAHASTHAAAGSDPLTLAQSQVTNLVSDLAGKQAAGSYITAISGDVVATGPGSAAATIQANSVALGTDTTGGYAGSSTEGGSATTADALAANGTNCGAGNYPLGVDAAGNAEDCTAAGGGASLPVTDTTSIAEGSSDGTKEIRFEVDGMTASNTGVLSIFGTAAQTRLSATGRMVSGEGFYVGTGAGTTSSDRGFRFVSGHSTWGDIIQFVNGDLSGIPDVSADQWFANNSGRSFCAGSLTTSGACLTVDSGGFRIVAGDNSANGPVFVSAAHQVGPNGSDANSSSINELLTLSTGGATTVTSTNLAVATARLKAISYRVTTTITTATDFSVKVTGGNNWCSIGTATTAQTGLTAGSTGTLVPCAADGNFYTSTATTLTVTTTGTPGAGAVRLVVHYEQFTPPTS